MGDSVGLETQRPCQPFPGPSPHAKREHSRLPPPHAAGTERGFRGNAPSWDVLMAAAASGKS